MKDTSSQQKSNFGRLVTSGNVRVALALVDACNAPDIKRRHLASARAQLAALQAECVELERECAAFEAADALDAQPEPVERQASLFGDVPT